MKLASSKTFLSEAFSMIFLNCFLSPRYFIPFDTIKLFYFVNNVIKLLFRKMLMNWQGDIFFNLSLTNWKIAFFISMILIVDANGLQAMDFLTNILIPSDRENDLYDKLQAFGMEVSKCNGHNLAELLEVLKMMYQCSSNKPSALIAKTIKGYGLKCMENIPKFHFRLPTKEELDMGWTD